MTKTFEPYFKPRAALVFHQWESSEEPRQSEPVIDEQEILRITCEQLKEEARAQGYAEGMRAAEADILQKQKEFSKALSALMQPMQLLDETLIEELIKTMLWICQACIGIELSVNPDKLTALFNLIKEELPSLKGNKILALNPEDFEWVRQQSEEGIYAEIQNMLVADPNLSRGDFYLQSEQSVLDGQVIARLSNLFSEYVSKADFIATPKNIQE